MKRFVILVVAGIAAIGAASRAATENAAPAQRAEQRTGDHQDIVYFGEARPLLIRLHVTVEGKQLAAVWDDYIARVFRHLDVNGAGFLDPAAVQRVPAPGVLFGGDYGGAAPTLNDLDTNGDGKVSRAELAAYYRRLGATPFQVASERNGDDEMRIRLYLELMGEQLILNSGGRGRGNSDDVNETLFKLLDTNGDGKLSREELLAAPAVLLKRDRNDDEMITPDEILPGTGAGSDQLAFVLLSSRSSMRRSGTPSGPVWLAHAGASTSDLARRLLQQYLLKNAPEKPLNSKLARKDLGLDEATFAKLDVDGDGLLDSEELSRFAQRPPDLELKVDLGPKSSVELVKRGRPLEANVRTGSDGTLMLEMGGTRLDLKGLAEAKVDAVRLAKEERVSYLAEFKRADRDKNGYLDKAEAMRSPLYRSLFTLMDRDGKGMLFENDVLAFLDAYQGLQAAAHASCATISVTSDGKGLFELLDTNGDGRLSVRELRNAVQLLADLDRSGTGFIGRIDIPRCSVALFRMGPANGDRVRTRRVVAINTGGMVGAGKPAQSVPRGPEWFRKMDRNGDGDVSRREFLGTDEQFRTIDTNGDGLISVEEAEAYEKKMREKK